MTPDPITTAREALDKAYEVCRNLAGTAESDFHAIAAALDYAEKLKAEGDGAREHWKSVCEKGMDDYKAGLDKVFSEQLAELKAKRFVESLDVVQGLTAEITRLTSQLEQAREIISPFADAARSFTVSIAPDGIDDGLTVGARIAVMPDYEAVLSTYHFSRASQWIKDRQEKPDGEAS